MSGYPATGSLDPDRRGEEVSMELDYERLDPELKVILPALPSALADIRRDNLADVRATMEAQPVAEIESPVETREQSIPGPAGDLSLVIYARPSKAARPGLLWIHGGGYILGSARDDRARRIAEQLDVVVVSVEYRLAPEHPFPAGPEDCHAALLWMAKNAESLGVDRDRIALGGASAGGGMAAGVALMNRDRGGPDLRLQLLLYPMIDNLHDTRSGQIVNHPVWNRGTSFNAWEMYLDGVPGEAASPYAAASRAKELAGLPPAHICVGAEDLFRDEDIEYARRLLEADVPCELAVYPGLFHGGDMFMPSARVSQRLEAGVLRALADAFQL
jgi:acetyl esterase